MSEIHVDPPVLFTLGLHAHQPEGNFGHVFEAHLEEVYAPFLRAAMQGDLLPLTLHLSGPLLDWLEKHGPDYLDLVGKLVSSGQVELLLAGHYEPILPSLLREDRVEQIQWMRDSLRQRFGVDPKGLWLTERVWEPDLAADLADAGVEYVLVDDRHFVASGFSRDSLHGPFRTEASGRSLAVFAIDEKLRYLIPFHAPEETAEYVRQLKRRGSRLAVAADDIEKFGGWPGTREWVYEQGWLQRFIQVMKQLEESGEIRLVTFGQALAQLESAGLAYLPSASYREMEEWSLPLGASERIPELKDLLGEDRFVRGESPLIRGSHWRNFLVKYPEANRMHKKMLALSRLCRERGNPRNPRRAIGRAQCNDAYWHGVFGGLYLRHLRDTVWRNLAEAEGQLRARESLGWRELDLDMDGHQEIWIHSSEFSSLLSPRRGGAVEELTLFRAGVNFANTLTRRREPYHGQEREEEGPRDSRFDEAQSWDGSHSDRTEVGEEQGSQSGHAPTSEKEPGNGTPSIHDIEKGLRFTVRPPVDLDDRAIFVERVLSGETTEADYRGGRFKPLHSWARTALDVERIVGVVHQVDEAEAERSSGSGTSDAPSGSSELFLEIRLVAPGGPGLGKTLRYWTGGVLEAQFSWDPMAFPGTSFFTTELSLGADSPLEILPAAEAWQFPITTFSKSERGFDESVQGQSILIRWPVESGWGKVRLGRP